MKNDSDFIDELIYKCNCGGSHFLEVFYSGQDDLKDDECDKLFCLTFIDQPLNLWQWIKSFMRSKRFYLGEIYLTKKQTKELNAYLSKYL